MVVAGNHTADANNHFRFVIVSFRGRVVGVVCFGTRKVAEKIQLGTTESWENLNLKSWCSTPSVGMNLARPPKAGMEEMLLDLRRVSDE